MQCTCSKSIMNAPKSSKEMKTVYLNILQSCPVHLSTRHLMTCSTTYEPGRNGKQKLLPLSTISKSAYSIGERVYYHKSKDTFEKVVITDNSNYHKGEYSIETLQGSIDSVSTFALSNIQPTYGSPRTVKYSLQSKLHVLHTNTFPIQQITKNTNYIDGETVQREISRYSKLIQLKYETDLHLSILYHRRSILYIAIHEYEKAYLDGIESVQYGPLLSINHYRLGVAAYCVEKFPESMQSIENALRIDPVNPVFHYALRKVQLKIK